MQLLMLFVNNDKSEQTSILWWLQWLCSNLYNKGGG